MTDYAQTVRAVEVTVQAVEALLIKQRALQEENAELRVLVAAHRRPGRMPRPSWRVAVWLALVGGFTILLRVLLHATMTP